MLRRECDMKNILEGLEHKDMVGVIHDEIHVDQYKSKMGNDEDIIVLSFKLRSKNPAEDFCDFLEKGYNWVLDADTSSGELDDGKYLVFVELERTPEVPKHLEELLSDMENLTEIKIIEWRFYNQKDFKRFSLNEFGSIVALTPDEYLNKKEEEKRDLDALKMSAGVSIKAEPQKLKEYQKIPDQLHGIR